VAVACGCVVVIRVIIFWGVGDVGYVETSSRWGGWVLRSTDADCSGWVLYLEEQSLWAGRLVGTMGGAWGVFLVGALFFG